MIIDPNLILSLPSHTTASTGLDAFCHAFESFHHPAASSYSDLIAQEAMHTVAAYLHGVIEDGTWIEDCEALARADILAGLCIVNVWMPPHGESLAVRYPEFIRFTFPYVVTQFSAMGRIFNPSLNCLPDEKTAIQFCEGLDAFLNKIGMWLSLKGLGQPWKMMRLLPRIAGYYRTTITTRTLLTGRKFYQCS